MDERHVMELSMLLDAGIFTPEEFAPVDPTFETSTEFT